MKSLDNGLREMMPVQEQHLQDAQDGLYPLVLNLKIQDILVKIIGTLTPPPGAIGVTHVARLVATVLALLILILVALVTPPVELFYLFVPSELFLIEFSSYILYLIFCTLTEMWGFFNDVLNIYLNIVEFKKSLNSL